MVWGPRILCVCRLMLFDGRVRILVLLRVVMIRRIGAYVVRRYLFGTLKVFTGCGILRNLRYVFKLRMSVSVMIPEFRFDLAPCRCAQLEH